MKEELEMSKTPAFLDVAMLGISRTAVENNVAWLKKHGYVRRIGGDKGGRREVAG